MSEILITGSSGVIGSKLMERFPEAHGIDLLHSDQRRTTRCDVGEFRQLEREIRKQKPDLVYHTAAEFGRWNGEDYYEQLWRTNAVGTKNLIRLQEEMGFRMVHFSSSEVYGDYPGVMREDVMEKEEVKQLNDYAMSKWVNEMQIRNSAEQNHTETVTVRLFNTYGPGEWYHPYRSVNARFVHHALFGLPVTVYRGHVRTSTFVDDTVDTLARIPDNFKPGEVYNIGGNQKHTIEDLADIIWAETGAPRSLLTYADSEPLTTMTKLVDSSKAIADLGHDPQVRLSEGVEKTVDWMRRYYDL